MNNNKFFYLFRRGGGRYGEYRYEPRYSSRPPARYPEYDRYEKFDR